MAERSKPVTEATTSTSAIAEPANFRRATGPHWRIAGCTADLDAETLALVRAVKPSRRSIAAGRQLKRAERDR